MMLFLLMAVILIVVLGGAALFASTVRRWHASLWFPDYIRQSRRRRARRVKSGPKHVMFCFVDHFEPRWRNADYDAECRRVARWCDDYPKLCSGIRDGDGQSPKHSFFYPEEEYRPEHLDKIADLCAQGFGEIEVHLHHDSDTADGLREKLNRFVRILHDRHGALVKNPSTGKLSWAFIHGNWALDNSRPDGRWCGVDNELRILREEGCYADFTFPSAPDATQPRMVNRIYYAKGKHAHSRAADRGAPVRVGGSESGDLMIVQGPLGLNWTDRKFGVLPRLENADIRLTQPPSGSRVDHWIRTGICVEGREDWVFVKIHTHGTQDHDMEVLLGERMRQMFSYLSTAYNDGRDFKLHYVSARETFNIIKAAEAGKLGDPGEYRDFLLPAPDFRRA